MAVDDDVDIPETGAVFTFGRSRFPENPPMKFWIKTEAVYQVACGDEHAGVITVSGRVFMFGSNSHGQLGLGNTDPVGRPSCVKALKPNRVTSLACGRVHTIAASENGQVYCWGGNEAGQLGNGNKRSYNSPVLILSLEAPPLQLAAGSAHSLLLTDSGQIYCWGSDAEGQLGLGKKEELKPTELMLLRDIVAVASGYYHSLAVNVQGEVFVWGECEQSKLGLSEDQLNKHRYPQKIKLEEKITALSAGSSHSLLLTESGRVLSCGYGCKGQLGQGGVVLSPEPNFLSGVGNLVFVAVSAGEKHSAAITDGGHLLTWGCGRHGKLCHTEGSYSTRFTPEVVRRLRHLRTVKVACGGCHTVVLGLRWEETTPISTVTEENTLPGLNTCNEYCGTAMTESCTPVLKAGTLPPLKASLQDPPTDATEADFSTELDAELFNETTEEAQPDETSEHEEVEQVSKRASRLSKLFSSWRKKSENEEAKVEEEEARNSDHIEDLEQGEDTSPKSEEHKYKAEDCQGTEMSDANDEDSRTHDAWFEDQETKDGHKRSRACCII